MATTDDPALQGALVVPAEGEVPIVAVEVLVLMKLRASRPQDLADVAQLVAAGADVDGVLRFLARHGPRYTARFSQIAQDQLSG